MSTAADFDWAQVIHELQRPDGWRKNGFGAYYKRDGAVCLYGACLRVDHLGDSGDVSYIRVIEDIIREQFPDRVDEGALVPFNDHPDTTLADVIAVVEKAAVKAGELA